MSSTKKQNIILMRVIAIVFAILIILGFVGLLINSAENSPKGGQETTHASSFSAITLAVQNHQANNASLSS